MEAVAQFLRTFPSSAAWSKDCAYVVANPIKVAVIDSGVVDYIFSKVKIKGASFLEGSVESLSDSHWHTVSNSHGTKMVWLIHKMNPFCEIYAAKAHQGLGNQGLDVQAVMEASVAYPGSARVFSINSRLDRQSTGRLKKELTSYL